MEYYLTIKKNEIMPFSATWMDLDIVILSEVSTTEKEKEKYHISLYPLCAEMIKLNFFTKQKQTHRLKKTNLVIGGGCMGGRDG